MYTLYQVRWQLSLPVSKAQQYPVDQNQDQETVLSKYEQLKKDSQITRKGDGSIEMVYYIVKFNDYLIFSSYELAVKNQKGTAIEPRILMDAIELTY